MTQYFAGAVRRCAAGGLQASERLGGVTYAYARLPDGQSLTVQLDGEHDFAADGGLTVQPQPGRAHLFSGDSGLRL